MGIPFAAAIPAVASKIGPALGGIGKFLSTSGGGMIGSSVLGAMGSAFGGEDNDESERLAKEKRKTMEQERAQFEQSGAATQTVDNYAKMDAVLAKQFGQTALPLRLMNMGLMYGQMLGGGARNAQAIAQAPANLGMQRGEGYWQKVMPLLKRRGNNNAMVRALGQGR